MWTALLPFSIPSPSGHIHYNRKILSSIPWIKITADVLPFENNLFRAKFRVISLVLGHHPKTENCARNAVWLLPSAPVVLELIRVAVLPNLERCQRQH